jgi:hypothetical protein
MADNEEDLARKLVNPIYMMGSHPLVPDAKWLQVQAHLLKELGQKAYLRLLLQAVKETFGPFVP